jgi:hypothetical protein
MDYHEEVWRPREDRENDKTFYSYFQCTVEYQGGPCDWLDVKTGIKQGCNNSGFLFLIAMDWVRRTVGHEENGNNKT